METKKCSLSSRYLWIAILSIAIFIAFQCLSHCTLKSSQRETIDKYSEHIAKVDQCVVNFKQYALDNILEIQCASSYTAVDSLIKASFGTSKKLSESQHKVLTKTINTHFAALDSVRNRYEAKFFKDSLLLSAERTLLDGQTKNMIELHLDKIEHEYSNITMWAAILTLVFLVFSFYSMFKLEEYIKQGKETVDEIKKLKNESQQSVDDITTKHKETLESASAYFDQKINNLIQTYNDKLDEKVVRLDTISSLEIEKYNEKLENASAYFDQKINNLIQTYNEKLGEEVVKLDAISSLEIEKYNEKFNDRFKMEEDRIKLQYDDLKGQAQQLEFVIKTYIEAVEQLNQKK